MTATAKPSLRQAERGKFSGRCASETFLALVVGGAVLVVGATLVSLWRAPELVARIVRICQTGWAAGVEYLLPLAALVVPAILVAGLLRGTLSLGRQWWLTRRHLQRLGALSRPAPRRLREVAERAGIGRRIAFVVSGQPFAFCGGLWQPRVWASAGLLECLDDDELAAVLRHEAHHLHRRDPLRLLAVRAVRDALFFLPVVRDLSWWYELEQEICADRAAGEVLPLASALHKLLVSGSDRAGPGTVALSGLSVTEARVRQLLRPESRPRMTLLRPSVMASLAVVLVMLGLALAPIGSLTPHPVVETCNAGQWISIPATFIR